MSKDCKSYGKSYSKAKLDEKFEVNTKWKRAKKVQLYVSTGLLWAGRTLLTEDSANKKMKYIGHVLSVFGVAGIVSTVCELVESNANHNIQNSLARVRDDLNHELIRDLGYDIYELENRVDELEHNGLDSEE